MAPSDSDTQTVTSLIERINGLNTDGIKFTCASPPDYDCAFALHREAAYLAKSSPRLHPDYLAFSVANIGYARRKRGDPRREVLSLLENTLQATISSQSGRISAGDSLGAAHAGEAYAGRARLLEEIGLVRRYAPDSEDLSGDLKTALGNLEEAVRLYGSAISQPEAEIISLEKLKSRRLRCIGVASTIATEISRSVPTEEITHYLEMAVSYAQDELSGRLQAGEQGGFNLANAYHTLGVAQSELASEGNYYDLAKENFRLARQFSREAGDAMTVSVLSFREAWLEYKRDPLDSESIRPHLVSVLGDQRPEKTYWNSAVRMAIQTQMHLLAAAVGGAEQSAIDSWYK